MKTMLPPSLMNSLRCLKASTIAWWHCLLVAIGLFGVTGNAFAQSYGPPAILSNGTVNTWAQTAFDEARGYSYDQYSSFLIDQNENVYSGSDPDTVIDHYDPSSYTFSSGSLLAANADGQAINPTPKPFIVASGPFLSGPVTLGLTGTNYSNFSGNLSVELDYADSNGNWITIHRYYNNGGLSGDVSGSLGGETFSGTFSGSVSDDTVTSTPLTDQNFNPANVSFYFTTNTTVSPSRQGPPNISWNGLFLAYIYTDSNGNDFYQDIANSASVTINNGSSTSGSGPSGNVSGTYNSAAQTFNVNVGNFFGMDENKNPIGLQPGLVIVVGFSGFARSILLSNNTNTFSRSPDYYYQRADGNWANEYVGLPANYWYLVADDSGNYNSQIYVTTDTSTTSTVLNATPGWPVSNAYPPRLYVNYTQCPLVWDTHFEYSYGSQFSVGSAEYVSADNSVAISLQWTWNNGAVSWIWYYNGYTGAWDGVSTFSNPPPGIVISLNAPSGPLFGPGHLLWNGSELTYNAASSAGTNADVYQGTGVKIAIDGTGKVSVFLNGSTSAAYTGSYDAASHLFNLGTGNFGTIEAKDTGGSILGTTNSTGNLDIPGNVLSLGSWLQGNESINGFLLSFTPPPDSASDALLRFGSTISLTDWVWSHAVADGASEHRTSMQLDANNRLLLFAPTDDSSAQVVLDPVNGSWFHGPLRVQKQGDVSMGVFQSGPQPNP